MTGEEKVAILQGFVDRYGEDLATIVSALGDSSTPEPARRTLVGALSYGLDMLDLFPDHYKGLGMADDAIVLRLAAKQAIDAGASNPALAKLAGEAARVGDVMDDLAGPLGEFVAKLPDVEVRGRTATKILGDRDVRALFLGEVDREAKRHKPQAIDVSAGGPDRAIAELKKMASHALKKAGILKA
jgi:uncharacterized membrane protein YkvA (DUF1232 family)